MTTIKERGQFSLTDGAKLAKAANTDAKGVARFTGLSEKAVARVLDGKPSTWVRCAKVARALNAMGAADAGTAAISRQGA